MSSSPGPAKDDLGVLPIRRLAIGSMGLGKSGRAYRLVTPIAKGGMGELYLSTAKRAGHPDQLCVIKRLLEEHKTDTDYVAMFRFEAEMMTHLDHPNIVKIFDVPVIEETQCLALEYVKGRSVGQVIDHSNEFGHPLLPAQAVLRILIGVLEGLDHVHNAKLADGTSLGLVHRDVTPGNLLLSFDGAVKITDFGIAKGQMSPVSTTVGIVKGKARYLSPEQILGERATPRSDLFASACVAYEMLTGFPLFEQSSVPKTLYAIVNGERPDLASALPRDALALVRALDRALSTDVSKRPQSALEFADDLREAGRTMNGPMSAADLGRFLRDLFKDAPEAWESPEQLEKLIAAAEASDATVPPPPPPLPPPPPPAGPDSTRPPGSTARIRAETFNEFEALEQHSNGELFITDTTTNEDPKKDAPLGRKLEAPKIQGAAKPDLARLAASISAEKAREAKLGSNSQEKSRAVLLGERIGPADPASVRPPDDSPLERAGLPQSELDEAVTQHAAAMPVPVPIEHRLMRPNEMSGAKTEIESSPKPRSLDPPPPKAPPDDLPKISLRFDDDESVTESRRPGASLPVFALGLLVGVGATLVGLRLLSRVDRSGPPPARPAIVAFDAGEPEPDAGPVLDADVTAAAAKDAEPKDAITQDSGEDEEEEAAPSPPVPVPDDKNGRLDVLFPIGARVKIDGRLLDEKVPIRGLVVGPGAHQIQLITKNKRIKSKLNVSVTAGQRVVLDKKQLQGR
ncbi:MAG: serine/threonine protein kinase [Deltaproteobacteria bacterium]|nr:serine/threonine protein kinase [Deltaproteobacteria bacterium]